MSESMSLRVCSYNIHKGFCAANINPVLQQLRRAIRTVDSELVFLQEVVGEKLELSQKELSLDYPNALDGDEYPQFEYLADEVWPHYAYGRNAIYQRGHHGNAILSKIPFVEWSNVDVTHWWFSQRGILLGKLATGLYVACVHFGLFSRERKKQLKQLLMLLTEQVPNESPLIIAGDFNDWRGTLHRCLINDYHFGEAYSDIHGKRAKTFPARMPLLAMDRIYYKNIKLIDAEVLSGEPWQLLSDHCALHALFSLDLPGPRLV